MLGNRLGMVAILVGIVALVGCGDLDWNRTGGPVGNEAQSAADAAASLDQSGNDGPAANTEPTGDETAVNTGESGGNSRPTSTEGKESGSHVGKTKGEVLDAAKLKSDPNWKIVADDPAKLKSGTIPGTAYNRAAALSGTANLTKWLQMQHALNDSYPSYDDVIAYMEKNPSDMPALQKFRHYGYDETTGQMVILENKEEEEARDRELGIE